MTQRSNSIKMLRIEQVEEKVGYKKSTIFEWMNTGSPRYKSHFPPPRKNGRSNRWFESEIDDFCLLEFGGSNHHPIAERGGVVNNPGDGAGISGPPLRAAIKIGGESVGASGKSRLAIKNIPRECVPLEQIPKGLQSQVAAICKGETARAHPPANPLSTADAIVDTQNSTMAMSDAGSSITVEAELSSPSPVLIPVPNKNPAATVEPADPTTRPPRVIGVTLTKKRTFVWKD